MLPLWIGFKSESETGPGASGHPIQESPHGLWATKKLCKMCHVVRARSVAISVSFFAYPFFLPFMQTSFHCFHPDKAMEKDEKEVHFGGFMLFQTHLKLFLNLLQDSLRRLTFLATSWSCCVGLISVISTMTYKILTIHLDLIGLPRFTPYINKCQPCVRPSATADPQPAAPCRSNRPVEHWVEPRYICWCGNNCCKWLRTWGSTWFNKCFATDKADRYSGSKMSTVPASCWGRPMLARKAFGMQRSRYSQCIL